MNTYICINIYYTYIYFLTCSSTFYVCILKKYPIIVWMNVLQRSEGIKDLLPKVLRLVAVGGDGTSESKY
jgi:hypothetical protein